MAGFWVLGVDVRKQSRYPYVMHQRDAIEFIRRHGHRFSFIHASPPCQAYSKAQKIQGRAHPDLIDPTREALQSTGRPWVIENVEEARSELRDPIMLCGASFGLRTYRHRLFEFGGGFKMEQPEHLEHKAKTVKMGRALEPGDFYHAVGNFSNVEYVRQDLGVPWMSRDGIRECVPPAMTQFIGRAFLSQVS